MTFEEILPGLKAKKKYVRTGWGGGKTMSNCLIPSSKMGGSGSDTLFPHQRVW